MSHVSGGSNWGPRNLHMVHRGPELRSVHFHTLPKSVRRDILFCPLRKQDTEPRTRAAAPSLSSDTYITFLWLNFQPPVCWWMDVTQNQGTRVVGMPFFVLHCWLFFFTLGNIHNKLGNSKKSWGQSWYMTPSKKEKKRKSPWHQNSRIKIATSNSCANLLIVSGEYKLV